MIPISLEAYFEIYVSLFLIVAAGFWAYHLWRSDTHNWSISEEKLCRCKECSLTYIVGRSEHVSRCPRCDEVNNVNPKVKI
jgi:uncharacterized paraquat-inducible protein A